MATESNLEKVNEAAPVSPDHPTAQDQLNKLSTLIKAERELEDIPLNALLWLGE